MGIGRTRSGSALLANRHDSLRPDSKQQYHPLSAIPGPRNRVKFEDIFDASDWRHQHDFFHHASDAFDRDLHVVIFGTLGAGMKHLARQHKRDLDKLAPRLEAAQGDYRSWLEDSCAELWAERSDQERFFRNMATVAIATRLIQTLRKLLSAAEIYKFRKPCKDTSKSEIMRLWTELGEHFGLDIAANQEHIAFAAPLNDVRNQIVHDGGQANPELLLEKCNLEGGDAGILDLKFSTKYPEYVEGSGMLAEVNVSMEQVRRFGDQSLELLKWVSSELRKKQLEFVETEKRAKTQRQATA